MSVQDSVYMYKETTGLVVSALWADKWDWQLVQNRSNMENSELPPTYLISAFFVSALRFLALYFRNYLVVLTSLSL